MKESPAILLNKMLFDNDMHSGEFFLHVFAKFPVRSLSMGMVYLFKSIFHSRYDHNTGHQGSEKKEDRENQAGYS